MLWIILFASLFVNLFVFRGFLVILLVLHILVPLAWLPLAWLFRLLLFLFPFLRLRVGVWFLRRGRRFFLRLLYLHSIILRIFKFFCLAFALRGLRGLWLLLRLRWLLLGRLLGLLVDLRGLRLFIIGEAYFSPLVQEWSFRQYCFDLAFRLLSEGAPLEASAAAAAVFQSEVWPWDLNSNFQIPFSDLWSCFGSCFCSCL